MDSSSKNDLLFTELNEASDLPLNVDRRSFLIRNAVIGAAAVMTGSTWSPEARAQQAAKEAGAPKLGASL
jgi:L-serine dehydratase